MTKTAKGSPNGIQIIEYQAGEEYDLPEALAKAFDSMDVCEVPNEKMVFNTPNNKSVSVPDNKQIVEEGSEEEVSETESKPKKRRRT